MSRSLSRDGGVPSYLTSKLARLQLISMSDEEREKTLSHVRVEQEELEAIKQTVLTRLRRILVDSVDPANHLSYLRSKFVFTERDAEEISAPPSRSARAEVFLDKLSRKGSQGYDEFQNSLCRDRTQMFLLTSMTKTFELLKHKLRDFKGIAHGMHQ